MSIRTWLYSKLSTLTTVPAERVFAKKSMRSSVEDHPYIVWKLGNNTSNQFSETEHISNQFIQIFVHDYTDSEVSDYSRIDTVIEELKSTLQNAYGPEDGVIQTTYLETSQDLNDETLGTIMKYVRFQSIVKG